MNTTYFLNQIMGNLFRTKITPPLPTSYYLGLSTSEPNIAGVVTGEPSTVGTGYSRIELTGLSEPTNGQITNPTALSFPESVTAWGTMLYYIAFDSATNGNLLFYGSLEVSRTVESNTVLTVKAGELTITLKNPTLGG